MSSSLLKICVYSLEKGTSYNFVGISNTHGAEWSNGLIDYSKNIGIKFFWKICFIQSYRWRKIMGT